MFQNQSSGVEYFGIDINQEVIDKNREHFGENGKFFRADIFETDFLSQFEDNEFLIGFSDAFLQCLPFGEKKRALIQEMLRVCTFVIFSEYTNPPWDYERVIKEEKGHQTAENLRRYSSKFMRYQTTASLIKRACMWGLVAGYHGHGHRLAL